MNEIRAKFDRESKSRDICLEINRRVQQLEKDLRGTMYNLAEEVKDAHTALKAMDLSLKDV